MRAVLSRLPTRLRRARFVWSVRLRARFVGATVRLDIDPTVQFAGTVLTRIYPGTTTTIRIGAESTIGANVLLVLDGGTLDLGRRVTIRAGVVFHLRGRMVMADQTLLSYYSVIHCDEEIRIGTRTALGEHLTIIDSTHLAAPRGDWWVSRIETAPVALGEDIWGGAKVTIGRGVTVGSGSILAAGCVVNDDVADDVMVGGVPARVLRASDLRSLRS